MRAAASAFVKQKLYAIKVLKDAGACGSGLLPAGAAEADFFKLVFFVEPGELGNLVAIEVGNGIAECVFEGALQHAHIAIFAKNERHNQPVVSRAYLPVSAAVSQERAISPAGNVGWAPLVRVLLIVEIGGGALKVTGGEHFAPADGLRRLAHHYAIHDYFVAGSQIAQRKFVLSGNRAYQLICGATKLDLLTRRQVR
jgi:hypothetical protein